MATVPSFANCFMHMRYHFMIHDDYDHDEGLILEDVSSVPENDTTCSWWTLVGSFFI